MTTIFLTGDRALAPLTALSALVAALDSVLAEWPEGTEFPHFATGDSDTGIERAARYLFPGVRVFATEETTEDGKPDFRARNAAASVTCDRVLVVHTAPMESSIFAAAVATWDDDDLMLWPGGI